MSRKIEDLETDVQPAARAFLDTLQREGVRHVLTSTRRTMAEQIALYAQGRAHYDQVNALREDAGLPPIVPGENRYVVTNCDGINRKSRHQSGRALDVVPANAEGKPIWPEREDARWEVIGKIGESFGFTWGGRWKDFPDPAHHEMP